VLLEPKLRYLADMNISPKTVAALRQRGVDVIRVSSLLPVDTSDEAILDFARKMDMVLISQDLDFSSLLAVRGYERPSLITLRLFQTDPDAVTERLWQVIPTIEAALSRGCAVTVQDTVVRVRPLPLMDP